VAESFWLGAFAKAIATVVSFPFSRAKVMITTDVGSGTGEAGEANGTRKPKQSKSAMVTLIEVLKRDGVVSLYQGLTVRVALNNNNCSIEFGRGVVILVLTA
jgi:hypothetical protein